MKIKKIKSKKEKVLIRLDVIVFVICFIIINVKPIINGGNSFLYSVMQWVGLLVTFKASIPLVIMVFALLAWILAFNLLTDCFWIIIIYLAYRIPKKKALKKNLQYEVIDNIEYYREVFNNITPAEISLIADLEIEHKKDIAASIVSLYQRGYINFNENTIILNNKVGLKPSELELITMIEENNFTGSKINKWEQTSIEEALMHNYIKVNSSQEKKKHFFNSGRIMRLAVLLLIVSIIYCINSLEPLNKDLTNFIAEYDSYVSTHYSEDWSEDLSDSEFLKIVANDPQFVELYKKGLEISRPILYFVITITLSFLIFVAAFWYKIIKKVFSPANKHTCKYERTKTGKILVEQIAGMQKYIHDFSLLSEKDKECVKVWEDFLVYAIVLEENESIVNEIFSYKNMDSGVLTSMNKFVTSNINV